MPIKLTKNEIEKSTKDPLLRFRNGIRSTDTLRKYERKLKILLCHTLEDCLDGSPQKREAQRKVRLESGSKREVKDILDADFDDRVKEFVDKSRKNPDWAEDILLAFSNKLKKRTQLTESDPDYLNPRTFSNYFKAPKKLFKMNNVRFNWDIINSTFPELDNDNETRGYDISEIRKILEFVNPLERAVIILLASSGIRRGGLEFTWDCIVPIYRKDGDLVMGKFDNTDYNQLVCGMISIYKKSSEQYFAFFTPECWRSIKSYKSQWQNDVLRFPQASDPFMKKVGPTVKPISPDAMAHRLYKILCKSGIRKPLLNGKRRHEVPVMNGFRRFFNKVNKETLSNDSPLAALIKKEMMLSHTGLITLDKNYFKTHWKELVEEYLQAVPALTINDAERLRDQNRIKDQIIKQKETEKDTLIKNLSERMAKAEKILKRFHSND